MLIAPKTPNHKSKASKKMNSMIKKCFNNRALNRLRKRRNGDPKLKAHMVLTDFKKYSKNITAPKKLTTKSKNSLINSKVNEAIPWDDFDYSRPKALNFINNTSSLTQNLEDTNIDSEVEVSFETSITVIP